MKSIVKKIFHITKIILYKYFLSDIRWSNKRYLSWNEALENSKGYNDENIINAVKKSALSVKKGNAKFERDGVSFEKNSYSWEILCSLLYCCYNKKSLRIADVGGSLGSMFFQYESILKNKIQNIEWNIFEQKRFVEIGKKNFESNSLHFFELENCNLGSKKFDVVIFGSVLNYLQDYDEVLKKFCSASNAIIVDRTSFKDNKEIRIQEIKGYPYKSSYPHIVFPKKELMSILETNHYNLIFEWDAMKVIAAPFSFEGLFAFKK